MNNNLKTQKNGVIFYVQCFDQKEKYLIKDKHYRCIHF